ncbi:hypothetical protein FHR93_003789 [Geodermatophilus sabuli]|uniref:Uncharacterized protein n=1 Tax=Geodermatophilus sabuli TaxID=1564158 RepID=A0A285ED59_9ACTN|nr:hypothetical protein [Geodermatophilus sabuli]SNX96016.1 hypothetical protein SAMN06893097_103185 [Geodermatophilus sabuli]
MPLSRSYTCHCPVEARAQEVCAEGDHEVGGATTESLRCERPLADWGAFSTISSEQRRSAARGGRLDHSGAMTTARIRRGPSVKVVLDTELLAV